MLTRKRKKGQSSSEAQSSQFSSVQGRRGGTMGVSGKVPVLQYCSWKASWGQRGLSALSRDPPAPTGPAGGPTAEGLPVGSTELGVGAPSEGSCGHVRATPFPQ